MGDDDIPAASPAVKPKAAVAPAQRIATPTVKKEEKAISPGTKSTVRDGAPEVKKRVRNADLLKYACTPLVVADVFKLHVLSFTVGRSVQASMQRKKASQAWLASFRRWWKFLR